MPALEGNNDSQVNETARTKSSVQPRVVDVNQLTDEVVELIVPGSLTYRELVTRAMAQVCKRLRERGQFDDELTHEAVSAIGEAFNNVVIHSYAEASGTVKFIFRMQPQMLDIEVHDTGVGFDPQDEPDLEFPGLHESGMGLFIMRAFMDVVEHHNGSPNRLHMIKRLPEPVAS